MGLPETINQISKAATKREGFTLNPAGGNR
jgi:hypothetical protein